MFGKTNVGDGHETSMLLFIEEGVMMMKCKNAEMCMVSG